MAAARGARELVGNDLRHALHLRGDLLAQLLLPPPRLLGLARQAVGLVLQPLKPRQPFRVLRQTDADLVAPG